MRPFAKERTITKLRRINVEKTKVMRISRQSFPVKIMIDQKQLDNVESFKYFG
jgi:hypothetical protein